jgi:hypothetical protein
MNKHNAEPNPPTAYQREQDAWQRQLIRAVANAIGDWLTQSGRNLNKPIASLKIEELEGMGVAACSAYTEMRERRQRQEAAERSATPLLDGPLGI